MSGTKRQVLAGRIGLLSKILHQSSSCLNRVQGEEEVPWDPVWEQGRLCLEEGEGGDSSCGRYCGFALKKTQPCCEKQYVALL